MTDGHCILFAGAWLLGETAPPEQSRNGQFLIIYFIKFIRGVKKNLSPLFFFQIPSSLAMIRCCISEVPSVTVYNLPSRQNRWMGYSIM